MVKRNSPHNHFHKRHDKDVSRLWQIFYCSTEDTAMMRITNAMMTSNTKNNINLNKLNEDRLNTQIATGQVIADSK